MTARLAIEEEAMRNIVMELSTECTNRTNCKIATVGMSHWRDDGVALSSRGNSSPVVE